MTNRTRHCPRCGGVKALSYPLCMACSITLREEKRQDEEDNEAVTAAEVYEKDPVTTWWETKSWT